WLGLPDPGETRVMLQDRADVAAESMAVILDCWERMDPDRRGGDPPPGIPARVPPPGGGGRPAPPPPRRRALPAAPRTPHRRPRPGPGRTTSAPRWNPSAAGRTRGAWGINCVRTDGGFSGGDSLTRPASRTRPSGGPCTPPISLPREGTMLPMLPMLPATAGRM